MILKSFPGKFVGGFCALVGVFTISLPIPIVVNSFAGFYKSRLWRNEVAQKKRERVQEEKDRMRKEIVNNILAGKKVSGEVEDVLNKIFV